jgi:hypothetical protein
MASDLLPYGRRSRQFGHLEEGQDGKFSPQGVGGLSQGFQPWEQSPITMRLKGGQIERANNPE